MEALRLNFACLGMVSEFQKLFVIALGCHLCIFIKRQFFLVMLHYGLEEAVKLLFIMSFVINFL